MQPIHSPIPPEILELFIDEVGKKSEKLEFWATLQACALVSRVFRNRAHHHLFSSISFVQRPYSTPTRTLTRLWKFRELVHSGMNFAGLTGVLYHLRALALIIDGSIFDAYRILEDGDIAQLLRDVQVHSHSLESLTLQGSSYPIVWTNLTPTFRRALKDLCRSSPSMTTLNLENMVGVPNALLKGTNIRHVRFHYIEFEETQMAFGIFRDDLLNKGQLESIDIDYTFPFPQSNSLAKNYDECAMENYQSFFTGVKKLRYVLNRSDDLNHFVAVARSISGLETIELELSNLDNGFLRGTPLHLPLHELPHLHRLIIRHRTLVNIGMRHPLFKVMAILKSITLPKSLHTLELFFDVSARAPWTKPTHFFPDPKSWGMLDASLSQAQFHRVREVVMNLKYCPLLEKPWTFDEGVCSERSYEMFRGVFPLLSNSKSKRLDLNVTFCPGGGTMREEH
ncbi:hypothetical protein BDN70DRAFT_875175 [Pholiota conissans]|uniref:Uncharacterized protein n=1 Tax=Pholiota conissans TaxID=109636 RepID=A0A9P5Z797_9AGAR|nr:hypothetical protein BDN70DRAFT_875175 [Pholiota conissans]